MSIQREPIFAALFALVAGAPGIVTSSRRVRHWDDVSPADCPALFMSQKGQNANKDRKLPIKWIFEVDLIVYVKTDGDHSAETPATKLNAIVDAIEDALESRNRVDDRQTLGGLVYDCCIEGSIETDEGALGETAVAIIPVRLLVPAVDTSAFPLF